MDRAAKTVTQTVDYPDSTNAAVNVTSNGMLRSSVSKTGVSMTHEYDGMERQTAVRTGSAGGARSTATVTDYDGKGQVAWVADAASNKTWYAYDSATGLRIAVTNALGEVTHTQYDSLGKVLATWGATYPVAYDYDAFGRMTALYTYRGTNQISSYSDIGDLKSAMDRTTWSYDLATGLLTNKLYADSNGVSYAYTGVGKLASRTWARGLTTTYSYTNAAELMSIDYADAGTPDVSFAYDRLGRLTSAGSEGVGTNSFEYNPMTLALTNEIVRTPQSQMHIQRLRDDLGRPAGLALDADYAVEYGYDDVGRFSHVAWTAKGNADTATYAYVENSTMIAGYDVASGTNVLRVRRSFETNRDLITSISNQWNAGLVSAYDYQNDALSRRISRLDTRPSAPDPLSTNAFGYNARSELTAALMGTNAYGYLYDSLGNRATTTNNGCATDYQANELNQYSLITDNCSLITNAPTYDLDGNLLSFGDWSFTWDGENRLLTVTSNSTLVVSNAYDYMSRRVCKVTAAATNRFLYDGWNMIKETQYSITPSLQSTNLYVWGLDLSGSLQGAGGIGGLLSRTMSASGNVSSFLYCYDGNGNVCQVLDDSGAPVATFEYDAFGNTTKATGGPYAFHNCFRFSTKYFDKETGLYYYGQRFYSPALGRWLSRDPIGERGGLNRYEFTLNNAVSLVDAIGLESESNPAIRPDGKKIEVTTTTVKLCEVTVLYGDGDDQIPHRFVFEANHCSAGEFVGCSPGVSNKHIPPDNQLPNADMSELDKYHKNADVQAAEWNRPEDGSEKDFYKALRKASARAIAKANEICKDPQKCCKKVKVIFERAAGSKTQISDYSDWNDEVDCGR